MHYQVLQYLITVRCSTCIRNAREISLSNIAKLISWKNIVPFGHSCSAGLDFTAFQYKGGTIRAASLFPSGRHQIIGCTAETGNMLRG
jgi:hypothetical protein